MTLTAHRARTEHKIAKVSEATRADAKPAEIRYEKLQEELRQLGLEKNRVEAKISEVEEWKREQLVKVYRGRISGQHAATNEVEHEFRKNRKPLLKELHAIEERLAQIKNRLKTSKLKEAQKPDLIALREGAKLKALQGIEKALVDIRDILLEKMTDPPLPFEGGK